MRLFRCVPHGVTADGTEQHTCYDPGAGTCGIGDRTRWNLAGKVLGAAFGWSVEKNIDDATAVFFREHFCRLRAPHLSGVFDTVASLGLVCTFRRFFDARLVPELAYGYHAVSIDERRPVLDVTRWDEARAQAHQTIEQARFAAVHSDVGGGRARKGLSDIALEGMLERTEGAGLVVDRQGIEPASDPAADAQESLTPRWRLVGLLTGHWPTGASPRSIPRGSTIHPSVRKRMERRPDYDPDLPDE